VELERDRGNKRKTEGGKHKEKKEMRKN